MEFEDLIKQVLVDISFPEPLIFGDEPFANLNADETPLYQVYFDQPSRYRFNVDPWLTEARPCRLMFFAKTQVDFTPEQDLAILYGLRPWVRKFCIAVQGNKSINPNAQKINFDCVEVVKVLDVLANAIFVTFTIDKLPNRPVC